MARSDFTPLPLGAATSLLDHLLEGCQLIDEDFRYRYVNEAVLVQARRKREELIGRTMMECYPGIEETSMFATLRHVMASRVGDRIENVFDHPDGSRLVYDLRFVPTADGVYIFSLDVSERRTDRAAIVNDSHDAIIGRTLDGIITQWNPSAEVMFGWRADEIIGRPVSLIVPPSILREEGELTSRLLRGERISSFATQRQRKDGSVFDVSITKSLIHAPSGRVIGVSSIVRDVEELRKVHRDLIAAKEALELANRELEAFSYSVAHDLRAPLRSIDGFSQAVLEDQGDKLDGKGRRHLALVRESAQLMAKLIDEILELARMARVEPIREPLDVGALARAVHQRLSNAEPQRRVDLVVEGDLRAEGDVRLVRVLLENLIGNAWKFTRGRTHAVVRIGSETREGVRAFFVADNGAGFDMAHAEKLFGLFQRLHSQREFEGTGVGLATVKRVVQRHGGRVWAEGRVSEGATFHFSLGGGRR
jgi:PAS domain S-box-containing protein